MFGRHLTEAAWHSNHTSDELWPVHTLTNGKTHIKAEMSMQFKFYASGINMSYVFVWWNSMNAEANRMYMWHGTQRDDNMNFSVSRLSTFRLINSHKLYSFPKIYDLIGPDRKMTHSTDVYVYGMPLVCVLWSCKRNAHFSVCNQNLLKQIPCILWWNDIEWNRLLAFSNIVWEKKMNSNTFFSLCLSVNFWLQ